MKFKHAFHVLVDNFSVTYKQLLYRLVILVVALGIGWGLLTPFIRDFINSEALNNLISGVQNFIQNLLKGNIEELSDISEKINTAYEQLLSLIQTKASELVLTALLLFVLLIVEKWFTGLGNYTTAVIVNDKMSLRTTSPFMRTLISHFKEAAIYNLMYVPLSVLYDAIVAAGLFAVLFFMLHGIKFFFISVFLFALIMVLAIAVKMTFTSDWLPALVRGKMGIKKSFVYTFSRKNKNTFNVFSNFVVIIILILAVNIMATLFTFGVGLLLSFPASFVILISFEMVNFYDREELRYFIDKKTIIKPDKESILTREQFFRGTDSDNQP